MCNTSFRKEVTLNKHYSDCKDLHDLKLENISWVRCLECGLKAKSLGKHLSSAHSMNRETYAQKHPGALVKCQKTFDRYSNQNRENGNWIQRRRDDGDDLMDYRKKMGEAVSSAIMSNPQERDRRSKLLGELNRRDDARKRSRNTAIKTSARPEIQKARAERLAKWRNENFDVFYEKCIKAMHNVRISKPELKLRQIIREYDDSFVGNQRLHDVCITSKSRRKSVDIMSKKLGIILEFDGRVHFEPIYSPEQLKEIQLRDKELDQAILNQDLTLIRVSYDQFNYKTDPETGQKGFFTKECIQKILNVLSDPKPGIYRIGSAYDR